MSNPTSRRDFVSDSAMLAFGAMLAYCGLRMQRWQPALSAAEKKKRQAAAVAAATRNTAEANA